MNIMTNSIGIAKHKINKYNDTKRINEIKNLLHRYSDSSFKTDDVKKRKRFLNI